MKFLHISDIHLGCDLYHIEDEQRMKDYGAAWGDCLARAVAEKADFVLIGGDLFDKKTPAPRAMIHAISGLTLLKDAGIPAIAIEGNHDNVSGGKDYSWIHTLNEMGLLKFLYPKFNEGGELSIKPWNEENKEGGFIDIGRARIFGTTWLGASIEKTFDQLVREVSRNQREGAFHIVMLHTEIEGENISPFPLLSYNTLKTLKPFSDYVALGHIHKHYIIDNWAFNPGCLEITSISESIHPHGALLVEIDEKNEISYDLLRDYYQRPFNRVRFDVSGKVPEQVRQGVSDKIKREVDITDQKPVVEITFEGYLGFKMADLEIQQIREDIFTMTKALHVKIENKTTPKDSPIAVAYQDETDRKILEKQVIFDLVGNDNRFKPHAEEFSNMAIEVKEKALSDDEPAQIAEFIGEKVSGF